MHLFHDTVSRCSSAEFVLAICGRAAAESNKVIGGYSTTGNLHFSYIKLKLRYCWYLTLNIVKSPAVIIN